MNIKHNTRNIIFTIAGCLVLQFAAQAQSAFPITGTGVSITNPSGGSLILQTNANTENFQYGSIHFFPTGDIKLTTYGNFLDISNDDNITIASNGDTRLWSNRDMQLLSSGPLEIYCMDDFVDIHSYNGGVKIHSLYGSVHIHNLVSGTAPTDAVNKAQLDAAISTLGAITSGNLTALNKITESGGLPLWSGSAWPGGGGDTFWTQSGTNISFSSVNVGIGTATPTHMLTVNGAIRAKEIIVDTGWADDVFLPGYQLLSLAETESYIRSNGRLPGIPSAKEVQDNGASIGETQAMLLRKIEELTLHMIRMEKRVAELEAENAALKK